MNPMPISQTPHTIARPNDPLASKTDKQIYEDCIWASDEDAKTKIFLLSVHRFFDRNAQSSDMSYAQIARDCGLSESTAKKVARDVVGRWVHIERHKGYYIPGKGYTNRYHGIIPPDVVERVRQRSSGRSWIIDRRKATVIAEHEVTTITEAGVSTTHPVPTGVSRTTDRGIQDTHVLGNNLDIGGVEGFKTSSRCIDNSEGLDFPPETSGPNAPAVEAYRLPDSAYETFRSLCETHGQRSPRMNLRPLQRDETDSVLDGLMEPVLAEYSPEIAELALKDRLCAAKAMQIEDARESGPPKGRGVNGLRGWMAASLFARAAAIALERVAAAAKFAESKAAHVAHAENRFAGGARNTKRGGDVDHQSLWSKFGESAR